MRADPHAQDLLAAWSEFSAGSYAGHDVLRDLVSEKHGLAMLMSSLFSKSNETDEAFEARHIETLESAAEMGVDLAFFSLGVYYDDGRFFEEDKVKANGYFRRAADLGLPQAQYLIGVMFFFGTGGMTKDQSRGEKLLKAAATAGVSEAESVLREFPDGYKDS